MFSLSRWRERAGVRVVVGSQRSENSRQHAFAFGEHVSTTEAHDPKAGAIQGRGSLGISDHRIRFEVLAAVDFDDQHRFQTSKVREVKANRMLSSELVPAELAIAQCAPQSTFGIGRGQAQSARPHPNPLPHAGEGT